MRQILNKALKNYRHIDARPTGLSQTMRLKVSPTNARILNNQANQPVYLVGDAAWSAIVQLTNAEINTYLTDRASRGFNCIMTNLIDHFFGTNAPNNIDNVAPFTSTPFSTPNNTYFLRADYLVSRAFELGIYVLLAPLYLGFSGTEEGWDTEVAAASTTVMTNWGEYVANRYAGYPNVLWQVGGDQGASTLLTKINAFVTGLRNIRTDVLTTFHDQRGTLGSDNLAGATWLTLESTYTTELTLSTLGYEAYNNGKVHFNLEARYENEGGMDAQELRAQMYWAMLAGGNGHIFGNNPIWKFAYDGGDWVAALDDTGSLNVTRYSELIGDIDWSLLVPDQSHTLITSGYGTIDTADYAGAGISDDGTIGVIYMPSNRTMAVDMTEFGATTTAQWYDPTNGSYTADAASPLANTGSHNFSRATTNNAGAADWVLVLTSAFHPLGFQPWAWLDFSDASKQFTTNVGSTNVVNDGDRIGRIEDKSAGAHHFTQSVNNNRGTYKLNIKNSLPACVFAPDGAVDSLDNLTSLTSSDITVIVAFKSPASIVTATNYGIYSQYITTSGGNGSRITINGTTSQLEFHTIPTSATIAHNIAANTFYVAAYTVKTSGVTRSAWLNLTKSTDSTAVSSSAQTLTVGRQHTNNNNAFFTGHLLDVFVFTPALADAYTERIISWLNTKWAIF